MRKYLKWLSWRHIYCKIVRQEGTPESIAMGVALGLFVGFIIPVGGQLVVCIPLAFLLRANKVLTVMSTMITNPYTITFIYPVQCWFGSLVMFSPLHLSDLNAQMKVFLATPSWEALLELGDDLIIPFFVGGAAFAVLSSIPAYYIVRSAVYAHRRRKEAKILKRQALFAAACEAKASERAK